MNLFSQFIGIVVTTILMDIIQLGLYFPGEQTRNGSGNSKCAVVMIAQPFSHLFQLLINGPGSFLQRMLL